MYFRLLSTFLILATAATATASEPKHPGHLLQQQIPVKNINQSPYTSPSSTTPVSIAYIHANHIPFWQCTDKFARRVAADLGIDFRSIEAEHRLAAQRQVEEIIKRPYRPQYVMMQYYTGASVSLIKNLSNQDIKVFIVNTDSPEDEKPVVGTPRLPIRNWLGHMFTDDFKSGFQLAQKLIAGAKKIKNKDKIEIIGIGGSPRTTAGTLRIEGFKAAVKQAQGVKLHRAVFTQWEEIEGEKAAANLLRQYPNTDVIWAASDNLASGAIKSIKAMDLIPGKDVLVGGIDCSRQGLELIHSNEMYITLCGHFMEAGWALVSLFDYHQGFDFKDDPGLVMQLPMQAITKDNWQDFKGLMCDSDWHNVDFRYFSKYYNRHLKRYPFSLEALREQQIKHEAKGVKP